MAKPPADQSSVRINDSPSDQHQPPYASAIQSLSPNLQPAIPSFHPQHTNLPTLTLPKTPPHSTLNLKQPMSPTRPPNSAQTASTKSAPLYTHKPLMLPPPPLPKTSTSSISTFIPRKPLRSSERLKTLNASSSSSSGLTASSPSIASSPSAPTSTSARASSTPLDTMDPQTCCKIYYVMEMVLPKEFRSWREWLGPVQVEGQMGDGNGYAKEVDRGTGKGKEMEGMMRRIDQVGEGVKGERGNAGEFGESMDVDEQVETKPSGNGDPGSFALEGKVPANDNMDGQGSASTLSSRPPLGSPTSPIVTSAPAPKPPPTSRVFAKSKLISAAQAQHRDARNRSKSPSPSPAPVSPTTPPVAVADEELSPPPVYLSEVMGAVIMEKLGVGGREWKMMDVAERVLQDDGGLGEDGLGLGDIEIPFLKSVRKHLVTLIDHVSLSSYTISSQLPLLKTYLEWLLARQPPADIEAFVENVSCEKSGTGWNEDTGTLVEYGDLHRESILKYARGALRERAKRRMEEETRRRLTAEGKSAEHIKRKEGDFEIYEAVRICSRSAAEEEMQFERKRLNDMLEEAGIVINDWKFDIEHTEDGTEVPRVPGRMEYIEMIPKLEKPYDLDPIIVLGVDRGDKRVVKHRSRAREDPHEASDSDTDGEGGLLEGEEVESIPDSDEDEGDTEQEDVKKMLMEQDWHEYSPGDEPGEMYEAGVPMEDGMAMDVDSSLIDPELLEMLGEIADPVQEASRPANPFPSPPQSASTSSDHSRRPASVYFDDADVVPGSSPICPYNAEDYPSSRGNEWTAAYNEQEDDAMDTSEGLTYPEPGDDAEREQQASPPPASPRAAEPAPPPHNEEIKLLPSHRRSWDGRLKSILRCKPDEQSHGSAYPSRKRKRGRKVNFKKHKLVKRYKRARWELDDAEPGRHPNAEVDVNMEEEDELDPEEYALDPQDLDTASEESDYEEEDNTPAGRRSLIRRPRMTTRSAAREMKIKGTAAAAAAATARINGKSKGKGKLDPPLLITPPTSENPQAKASHAEVGFKQARAIIDDDEDELEEEDSGEWPDTPPRRARPPQGSSSEIFARLASYSQNLRSPTLSPSPPKQKRGELEVDEMEVDGEEDAEGTEDSDETEDEEFISEQFTRNGFSSADQSYPLPPDNLAASPADSAISSDAFEQPRTPDNYRDEDATGAITGSPPQTQAHSSPARSPHMPASALGFYTGFASAYHTSPGKDVSAAGLRQYNEPRISSMRGTDVEDEGDREGSAEI